VRARDLVKAWLFVVKSLSPMTSRALILATLLAAAACSDRDAPRPVPVPDRETAAAAPPSAAVDPDDPAEPGISDLARLARYVFRTMQRHEEVCPFGNPFRDGLHFALAIEVRGGRMARVGLGHVGVEPEAPADARTLAEARWPRELTSYVACLAPHLQAVTMAPSPADGAYEPVYSFSANLAGRAAP
jgi:hypothetical protein